MKETFRTHDLCLASALMELGHRFNEVQNHKGSALFVFADSESLRMAVSQYLSGDLKVKPRSFLQTWKTLRTKISEILAAKEKS